MGVRGHRAPSGGGGGARSPLGVQPALSETRRGPGGTRQRPRCPRAQPQTGRGRRPPSHGGGSGGDPRRAGGGRAGRGGRAADYISHRPPPPPAPPSPLPPRGWPPSRGRRAVLRSHWPAAPSLDAGRAGRGSGRSAEAARAGGAAPRGGLRGSGSGRGCPGAAGRPLPAGTGRDGAGRDGAASGAGPPGRGRARCQQHPGCSPAWRKKQRIAPKSSDPPRKAAFRCPPARPQAGGAARCRR